MKEPIVSAACLAAILVVAPLAGAQNADELLAVRFPARHGYITWPAASPLPTGRIALSGGATSWTVAGAGI
jgi:hypothetical protein